MALTLTVLGSSGTYAAPGDACSGYLVRSATTTLWLDCGPGTLANLQHHVDLAQLDAVVVTHEHPDHWLELPVLRNALKYGRGREHLPVHGTIGTRKLLDVLTAGRIAPTFDWNDLAEATVAIGDLELRFARTDHPVETYAVLVACGDRRFVYSSDTGPLGWGASLGDAAAGADLALIECTLSPDQVAAQGERAVHLGPQAAAQLAVDVRATRLVLSHLHPDVDRARQLEHARGVFTGPIDLAEPHRSFKL